ncbi:ribonuclease 3-like protein 2 [Iris pallida]|uniref:Ribonuclease 3-like protein 2 n=1 Tax=Iris pallida TaxID=29817 RepID=A0AAX6ECN2_IRIPA|nr:ribonuclease 3-like protein 2 [Iris pallida]
MLTVVNHRKKCNTWRFDQLGEVVKAKIKPTGLQNLAKYAYKTVDNALISAFVERWHPETNTFHLPGGEMTITLDDVHHILGLRVDGRVMMNDNFSEKGFEWYDEIVKHVSNSLGVDAETFTTLAHFKKSYGLPLGYLEKTFDATEAVGDNVDRVARGYMQFILGAVGIPDKSGMSHAKYILNFADLSTVEEISWGSGILAHLYRELGVASRIGSKTISGCQTLLHAWIYEHFPMLKRATFNEEYDEHLPRMCRWKPTEENVKCPHTLVALRNALEDMRGEEIVWDPYRDLRSSSRPLQPVALLHGLLSCHDIEEPYMPDRVLRQFGYVQTVPTRLLKMVSAPKGTKPSNYVPMEYNRASDFFNERQRHVIRESERQAVVEISDCSDDYIAYYADVGHPMLLNPDNRKGDKVPVASSLPAKSVLYAALLKMANKAKKLGKILANCKGENYIEINEQLQNIDNIIDFPFFENRE